MDSLIVFGAETLAGANLALALAEHCQVHAVSSSGHVALDGINAKRISANDEKQEVALLNQIRPDWIIVTGALSRSVWDLPGDGGGGSDEAARCARLAAWADKHEAALHAIGSDAVLGGSQIFQDENSSAAGQHAAASHARLMEQALCTSRALIVRTHLYGLSPQGAELSTVERVWQSLTAGSAVVADGRRYATPLLATDLAELLLRARALNLQGLYHFAGAERTSLYRLANELAHAAGMQPPRSRLSVTDVQAEGIPAMETSLNSRRARRALERPLPMLREGLQRFVEQARGGWRERMRLTASNQGISQAA